MKKFSVSITVIFLSITLGFTKSKKKDYLCTINTSFGQMLVVLHDSTPLHKENFIKLSKSKFYDSTTFHRIIKGFMIQGGDINSKDKDPNNDGMGSNGYTIPAEFNKNFTHIQGALAAARMGDNVNPKKESSGCQFYIVENPQGTHFLNNNYTVFGQVIKGIEVISKIAEQPKNQMDRPLNDIKISIKVEYLKKKKIEKMHGWKFGN